MSPRSRSTAGDSGDSFADRESPSRLGTRGTGPRLIESRLVALFLAGCVLFGYPLPGLFAESPDVGGIPALFLYFFVSWGAFIAALAWLVQSHDGQRSPTPRARRSRRE